MRLAHGTSIKSAYSEDNRDTRVAAGLPGLHHAKSVLQGKCRARCEDQSACGQASNAAASWLSAFEAVWAESTSVEDAAEYAARAAL